MINPHRIALMFVLFLFSLMVRSQPTTLFAAKRGTIQHDGYQRTWMIHLPKNYDSNKEYPLVIALHGGGGRGERFNRATNNRFNKLADKKNFIIVYPNGIDKGWNDGARDTFATARRLQIDDVGFIKKMIEQLEKDYSIDSQNIFACGISNGGFMSITLAINLPEKIKAAGVVAAGFSFAHFEQNTNKVTFPLILIHGTQDPLVPYEEGHVMVFRQKRGKVPGIEKSLDYFRNITQCTLQSPTTKIPDINARDNCHGERTLFTNPDNDGLKIEFIKVVNGGHTWPGGMQYLPRKWIGNTCRDFNACDEIWRFFEKLR